MFGSHWCLTMFHVKKNVRLDRVNQQLHDYSLNRLLHSAKTKNWISETLKLVGLWNSCQNYIHNEWVSYLSLIVIQSLARVPHTMWDVNMIAMACVFFFIWSSRSLKVTVGNCWDKCGKIFKTVTEHSVIYWDISYLSRK